MEKELTLMSEWNSVKEKEKHDSVQKRGNQNKIV